MDTSIEIGSNGVNTPEIPNKDALIQRIKHQQSVIKNLEEKCSNASLKRAAIRKTIKDRSLVSEQVVYTLKFKSQQNEKDLRAFVNPTTNRRTQALQELDSTKTVPTTSLPPNFNLSIPPPALPVTTSNSFCGLPVSSTTTLKRVSSNNIDLCSASTEPSFRPERIDPCIDLVLSRFLKSLKSSETQISANRAKLQRSKFTEDSQTGKRMMNRLRVLEAENEELSRQKECGPPAKVCTLIALRHDFIGRMKTANARTEKLIDEAESEVEVFTSTLIMLQQQLSIAQATIEILAEALETSRPGRCLSLFHAANWPLPDSLAHLAKSREVEKKPATPNSQGKVVAKPTSSVASPRRQRPERHKPSSPTKEAEPASSTATQHLPGTGFSTSMEPSDSCSPSQEEEAEPSSISLHTPTHAKSPTPTSTSSSSPSLTGVPESQQQQPIPSLFHRDPRLQRQART